ncbi:predicted phosphohydrolase [Longilinea arvoryzae]|uniref:Predicted phosphohydrolase n=1 Tax=Longilinea arvoryzae TaxID=360412 RepID=A0A0S7BKE8_9CHLR|nr:metallophosphoesterase [Longilinea arvoryzae]GAP14824.1 predicted phosphohydrolase [Longilinea arvoryzae]
MDNREFKARDFSKFHNFPGTANNDLDVILHGFEKIQDVPTFLFGLFLMALAFAFSRFNWQFALLLWGFFLSDWLLLELLPRFDKSFGPAKPPVFLLSVGRSLAALLPWPFNLAFQVLGTLLVIYGFWIEPHHIRVTHQTLVSAKLKPASKFKVLHLGDLHIERITGREKQLAALIKELAPDLILFSGDFLNLSYLNDPISQRDARKVLQEWSAPLGVFAVSGSPAVDLDGSVPILLKDLPIHWLDGECAKLPIGDDSIQIAGLTCSHKPFVDFPVLQKIVAVNPPEFTILLYHSPDLAPNAADLGIDLQLSGHTHGGQVRIPGFGALFTASLYGRRFQSGRYAIRNLVLYVTRGIGMEGAGAPRVRFLCPPEIILWEITGA